MAAKHRPSLLPPTAHQLERSLLAEFDLVLMTSDADRTAYSSLPPRPRRRLPQLHPAAGGPGCPEEENVAFSGNLEYHPNVSAVRYFHTGVWPTLRTKRPRSLASDREESTAVQDIVGEDPRIELTGEVEDAIEELARAGMAIVPLLAGSGTRVKIMEAWAAGRCVISSPIGAEGLPAVTERTSCRRKRRRDGLDGTRIASMIPRGAAWAPRDATFLRREFCWPAAWKTLESSFAAVALNVVRSRAANGEEGAT